MRFSHSVWVAASALLNLADAATIEQWKGRSVYQLMTDRYARTDGSLTATCEPQKFCGGTWAGLLKKLDYIQNMGFTAIQISPIVKNIDDDTAVGEAYHGYWSLDNYALNDRFGTKDDLKALVDELHKRDMYIMVDVVVNNMAQKFDNIIPPKVDYSKFNPFNDKKYFHPYCNVTQWDSPDHTNIQECWLYPYGVALADLATETAPVADEFNKWIKQLVSNYSIDGLRIDAAKHVNPSFLGPFVKSSGVFTWGEILTGEVGDFCPYQNQGQLPGMPNYLEYYKINTVFNGGSMKSLAAIHKDAQSGCNDTLALGSFVENHDMPRFANKNKDMALAKNAMAYILMTDGIPTVYQGQEQHFDGGDTPFNREPLWTSKYDQKSELYTLTATLNKARNGANKASNGTYATTFAQELMVDDNHYCMRKGPTGSQLVFCISNKSSKGDSYNMQVPKGFGSGDEIVELLTCKTAKADGAGTVTMPMSKGEPRVYALQSSLKNSGLCKDGLSAQSLNGAGGVRAGGLMGLVAVAVSLMFVM
ncbi:hypothetical protein PspLS_10346 [Pyricularia sp. CBS 133598]|nr:hypothetical protein PspLS_10346 [Pyricularia sp. CBS 133598]